MTDNTESDSEFPLQPQLVSSCCGAQCNGSTYETKLGNIVGRCSKCGDCTTFELEGDQE